MLKIASNQTLSIASDGDFQKRGVIRIWKRLEKRRCGNKNAGMGNMVEQSRYEFSVKLEARASQHFRVFAEQARIQA